MNIMGPPSEQLEVVQRILRDSGKSTALFTEVMVPALYKEALRYGIDPVVMIAQSAKETNYGRFTGNVKDWFCNTAGIKVHPQEQALLKQLKDAAGINNPDHSLDHQRFGSWTMGARGHAQHLRAYCGAPVPTEDVVHPRYWIINRRIKTVAELSGSWAPSPTYGTEIVSLARSLVEVGL